MIFLYILLGFIGLWAIYGLTLLISALIVDKNKLYFKNNKFYRLLLNSATLVVKLSCNVRTRVVNEELLPKDERFLFVCNHRSNFDPLMTYLALRHYDLSFVSKPENFDIPIFGKIIRKCCFRSINRDDPRAAMKNLIEAADILKTGEVSMGVYPEGTRSKGKEMLPFHNGVIKIAQKAKVPMVIACIQGTEEIHNNAPLKKTPISITILKVIPAEEVVKGRSQDLGDEAYKLIKEFSGV